uniref:Uncharacterized protein n=1 Tax=Arundo donax TaxID=35708 RepID=A0A0A9GWT3_ARUDO
MRFHATERAKMSSKSTHATV